MKIDDLALIGFAHTHVVHVANIAALCGKFRECHFHRFEALGRCFAPRGVRWLQWFDVRFDLTSKARFWPACSFGLFVYTAISVASQGAIQRYASLPSVAAGRRMLAVNGLGTALVCLLFFLLGTTMFAFYTQHPASTDHIFPQLAKKDQLTIHFVRTELAYPGLVGLLPDVVADRLYFLVTHALIVPPNACNCKRSASSSGDAVAVQGRGLALSRGWPGPRRANSPRASAKEQ